MRQYALGRGACRQAFRPRLLVLVALAACVYAYNGFAEQPVGAGVQLALFAGFLSYKVAPRGVLTMPALLLHMQLDRVFDH